MENEMEFVNHDVRKNPIEKEQVLKILKGKKEYFEKKGKKVQKISQKEANEETLLKMFLGRSGTLRAPVLMSKDKAIAGFEESMYKEITGK